MSSRSRVNSANSAGCSGGGVGAHEVGVLAAEDLAGDLPQQVDDGVLQERLGRQVGAALQVEVGGQDLVVRAAHQAVDEALAEAGLADAVLAHDEEALAR